MAYDGTIKFDTKIDNQGFDKGVKGLKSAAQKGAKIAAAAFATVAAGLGVMAGAAVKVGADFEEGMSKVAAVSGATGKDLEALTAKAEEMGAKTKFSATQSAEALNYMAMAGWKTEEMLGGLDGIMNLAAASGEELGRVSDIVTDALTAFGLKAKDSAHFADVLATASSNSNTNVSMMGETFKYVAPVAGALKYSVEDVAVAIGLMANSGIKAEQAGTSLRSIFTRLVKPPKMAAKALDELNFSAVNADGSMKPLRDTLLELREKFADLTDSEKASTAAKIAGTEAMSGMLALMNAGQADFDKLTDAIAGADGAALEMAETMQDNLKGQMTILGSSLEGLGIKVYDKFEVPLKNAAKSAIDNVGNLTASMTNGELSVSVEKLAVSVGSFIAKAAELAAKVIPKLINSLTWVIDHAHGIKTAIGAATAAVIAFKAANVLTKVVGAWKAAALAARIYGAGMSTSLTAAQAAAGALTGRIGLTTAATVGLKTAMAALGGPIGVAAIAIGALAAGLAIYSSKETEAEKATKLLCESVERQKESWDELKKSQQEQIDTSMAEIDYTETLRKELEKLTDSNGRVTGSKERVQFITEQINSLLPESISLLEDEQGAYIKTADAIDELMEKKKAEAVLEASEAGYKEAIKGKMKALEDASNLNRQIAEKQAEIEKLALQGGNSQGALIRLGNEKKALEDLETAYTDAEAVLKGHVEQIDYYQKLSTAITSGNLEDMESLSNQMISGWKDVKDETVDTLKQQAQDIEQQLQLLNTIFPEGVNAAADSFRDTLIQRFEEINEEAKSRGEETGISLTGALTGSINRGTGGAVDAAIKLGEAITGGTKQAIFAGAAEVGIEAANMALNAIKAAKLAIDSHSPSKLAAKEVGLPISQGVASGIEGGSILAGAAAKEMAKHALEAAAEELKSGKSNFYNEAASLSEEAVKHAKSKAKSYKEVGQLYIESMCGGLNENGDKAIKAIEKLVEKQIEAEEKAREKAEEELQTKIENTKNKNAKKQLQNKLELLKDENAESVKQLKESAKDQVKAYSDSIKTAASDAKDALSEVVGALADEFQTQYDNIIRSQEAMQDKLAGFGDLFVFDNDSQKVSLGNIEKQTKAMENYADLLDGLKAMGATDTFMKNVTDLGVDEGGKATKKLLELGEERFLEYQTEWEKKQALAKEIATKFYQDQLETLDSEFAGRLETALADVPGTVEGVGIDAMQGFMSGMESMLPAAELKARSIAQAIISAYRDEFDINSPSRKMANLVGKPVAQGLGVGMEEEMEHIYKRMKQSVKTETNRMAANVSSDTQQKALTESRGRVETYYKTSIIEKTPVIKFEGSLAAFAREMVPHIKMEIKRVGENLTEGGYHV